MDPAFWSTLTLTTTVADLGTGATAALPPSAEAYAIFNVNFTVHCANITRISNTHLTFYITKCFPRGIQTVLRLQLLGTSPQTPSRGSAPCTPLGALPPDSRTWGQATRPSSVLSPPFHQFLEPPLNYTAGPARKRHMHTAEDGRQVQGQDLGRQGQKFWP